MSLLIIYDHFQAITVRVKNCPRPCMAHEARLSCHWTLGRWQKWFAESWHRTRRKRAQCEVTGMHRCPAAKWCLKTGKVMAPWWRGLSWRCPSEVCSSGGRREAHTLGSGNLESQETEKTQEAREIMALKSPPPGSISSNECLGEMALQWSCPQAE